ncbi:MAG: hypothetical protein AABW81_01935 [Nanoarchaeota archaeon]
MVRTNKKGQLKLQQMIFMIVAVTLLFSIVGLFFVSLALSGIKEDAIMLEEKNAMLLVTKLANSPEFSCGDSFGGTRINCLDLDKAMALKENIAKYSNFWGVSTIEIRKIYPAERETICENSNYPDCNVLKLFSKEQNGFSISNFVALCRKESNNGQIYDKCELGKIIVSYEKKK